MAVMLGGLAGSLYMYNRENFIFNKTLGLKREYQDQGMRVKQFGLYREDVRDLMNLTVSKMDNYLLVSTLQLGFCITIITEGRPTTSRTPPWLVWLYATTLMGAFLYFLLSAWLAIHASIAAHSFGVRMLTQFVRLPVPNRAQLDAARSYATDYEGLSAREMLRIPVVKQQLRRLNAAMDNLTSQEADAHSDAFSRMGSTDTLAVAAAEGHRSGVALPQHTRLYRELQANWQAYDAYARVCIALGTNQMLYALGYDLLHMLILLELSPEPALACVIVCATAAWLLARLDLYLSRQLLTLAGVLLVVPPALSLVSLALNESNSSPFLKYIAELLILVVFTMHIVWIVFIVYIAKADSFGSLRLPRNFRTVLYLDVFGQMRDAPEQPEQQAMTQDRDQLDSSVLTVISAARGLDDSTGVLPPVTEDPTSFSSAIRRQESGGSMVRQRSSSMSSSLGRPELRLELAGLCRRLQAELQRDLVLWEGAKLGELVGEDGYECCQVAHLRAESDAVAARLEALAPGPFSGTKDTKDSTRGTKTRAWLKLEWNPSGTPTEFFYCCDSGDVAWIHPREPDVVLELQALEGQLEALASKVEALAELQPAEQSEVESDLPPMLPPMVPELRPPPPQPQPQLDRGATASTTLPPVDSTGSLARRDSNRTVAFSVDARSSVLSIGTMAPEDEVPAQETRFGGHEALHGQSLRSAFGVGSDSASQSFHPHRSSTEGLLRGVQQRRPPGQLPWHTFLKGSLVLIAVWVVGLMWVMSKILLRIDIPVGPAPPPEPDLRLVAKGPHPFFSATGLACHEASRSLFVTEKYAVHKLHLDAVPDFGEDFSIPGASGVNTEAELTALKPAFAECLAQAPDFHALGLRGIAVECAVDKDSASGGPPDRRCTALLLGAGGHRALRCTLVPAGAAPTHVAAFGGPWHGFLTSRGGEAVWAGRESDGAIVMLQRSFGTDDTLVPQVEVLQSPEDEATQFHIIEDSGMVLGLRPDGLLHARPLAGGATGWSRRLGAGRRWLGLCTVGEDLFLLGAPVATPGAPPLPAAVWRLPLPWELRRPQNAVV